MIITGVASGAVLGLASTIAGDLLNGTSSSAATYATNIGSGAVAGIMKNIWLATVWNSGVGVVSKLAQDENITGQDIINSAIQFTTNVAIGGSAGSIAKRLVPRGPGADPKKLISALTGVIGTNTVRGSGIQTMLEIALQRFKVILTGSAE